jgi:hypothetical protein
MSIRPSIFGAVTFAVMVSAAGSGAIAAGGGGGAHGFGSSHNPIVNSPVQQQSNPLRHPSHQPPASNPLRHPAHPNPLHQCPTCGPGVGNAGPGGPPPR